MTRHQSASLLAASGQLLMAALSHSAISLHTQIPVDLVLEQMCVVVAKRRASLVLMVDGVWGKRVCLQLKRGIGMKTIRAPFL
jgi:hypothetical protein